MARKLNARQRIFVHEYVWGQFAGNGGECARLAGFRDADPSHAGYQVQRKPHVKAAIETELKEKEDLVKLRSLRWVEHLEKLLEVDPKDLADENGNPLPVNKIPEAARRALAGVDIEELFEGRGEDRAQIGTVRKYRLHDKKGVAELLLKWAGKMPNKVDISLDKTTLEELVAASMQPDAKE